MNKWHNLINGEPEVPGNIFCIEPIRHNKNLPYTIEGICKIINGKTYINTEDYLLFKKIKSGVFVDDYNGWMIRYYTDLPKFPEEVINDYWVGYDNSSKKNLVENKIINKKHLTNSVE